MLVAIIPVIVLVVGLLLWATASKPLLLKVGEYMFVCGLLVTCLVAARYTLRLG